MDDAFSGYHPAVNFIFFIGAIVFGMFFTHSAFLCASVFTSMLYYLLLMGRKGIKLLCTMLMLFFALSFINPLLNTQGDTVLFTYIGERPFTLEALMYGFVTGGMFVSVLLWFACYNCIMTSDKFIYLFGWCIPTISLLLSMVLRMVPNFKVKIMTIAGARKCVGKAPVNGDKKEKLQNSMDMLSVLTSWALEGAVVTADSMRSRGYGSGKQSNFSIYRPSVRDMAAGIIMLFCIVLTIICAALGGMEVAYFPVFILPEANIITILGVIGYTAFLLLPSIIHIWEEATWNILRSRI